MYSDIQLFGDTLYGDTSSLIKRQALHSYKVKFIHPITKKELELIADLPSDMKVIIKWIPVDSAILNYIPNTDLI